MKNTFDELKELNESGEEFFIGDSDLTYYFREGRLYFSDVSGFEVGESDNSLNHILENGVIRDPWVPKEGDEFWFISTLGEAEFDVYRGTRHDVARVKIFNYYKTQELASVAKEKEIELRKTLQHE